MPYRIILNLKNILTKTLLKESLRDNMSTLELALNMLAEAATTEISKQQKPSGLAENRSVARAGGAAAKAARESVEESTGKPVITSQNAAQLNHVVTQMIEDSSEDAKAVNEMDNSSIQE